MAIGFPVKANYAAGDILTAAQMNDLSGTLNYLDPTAKGDLFPASSGTALTRLAVGANGETLVADSSTSTGLRYQSNYAAGKNVIINGDFNIWQRGTSFTASGYAADRFTFLRQNTTTVSRQTFTPGTAPVAGYEGVYFFRLARTTSTTSDYLSQKIENVQTFAGQTITLSFWAKADASSTVTSVYFEQNFGSGGSGSVATGGNSPALTTSWTRFSYTYSIASISGKTIGTSSSLDLVFNFGSAMGNRTIDIWGVQVEAGSVATAFQTATGTIQGELAACQRYYYRTSTGQAYSPFAFGAAYSATAGFGYFKTPITMRIKPATLEYSNVALYDYGAVTGLTNLTIDATASTPDIVGLIFTVPALTTVQYRPTALIANANTAGYIGLSAEL
jgi:hypothetical protein